MCNQSRSYIFQVVPISHGSLGLDVIGTNIGHFLVWNKCRTFLVRKKFRTFFGAEQMPDIFWCGANNGHLLVRNKCRTFIGADQISDIFGADQMPDIFWCGTNVGHSLVHLWVPPLSTSGGGCAPPTPPLWGGGCAPHPQLPYYGYPITQPY